MVQLIGRGGAAVSRRTRGPLFDVTSSSITIASIGRRLYGSPLVMSRFSRRWIPSPFSSSKISGYPRHDSTAHAMPEYIFNNENYQPEIETSIERHNRTLFFSSSRLKLVD